MKNTLLLFALITSTSISLLAQKKTITPPQPEVEYTKEEPVMKNVEEPICSLPEIDAEFPGGMTAINQYLTENLMYPQLCLENGISGKVFLQFIVEKDGSLSHIEVKKSPHALLEEESIRLIKNMPKWIPAKNKGQTVRSRTIFPITFAVQ